MSIVVKLGDWSTMKDLALPIRFAVFVDEQNVPHEEERDAFDPVSIHAIALNEEGVAVATGRLLPDGHIGRMSVFKSYRGLGIGSAVLNALVNHAREKGFSEVILHAQVHAKTFYALHAFEQEGGVFEEANIPHIKMRRAL